MNSWQASEPGDEYDIKVPVRLMDVMTCSNMDLGHPCACKLNASRPDEALAFDVATRPAFLESGARVSIIVQRCCRQLPSSGRLRDQERRPQRQVRARASHQAHASVTGPPGYLVGARPRFGRVVEQERG